jgi:NAD(P)H-hydrate epimerase
VLLNGPPTIVGRSLGNLYVNPSGNPELAQGGSGDVLAGFLAGLLAQPKLLKAPENTIRYAVWHHGAAADALSDQGMHWTVDDLAAVIGEWVE